MNSSKKLIYIANLRLPTEKAYGIQIAKMCEVFAAQGVKIKLVAPFRFSRIKTDFFEYYGVNRSFVFKKIFSPDFYLPGPLDKIIFGVKSFVSAAILDLYVLFSGADIYYFRDELAAYLMSFLVGPGKLIFEAHKYSPRRRFWFNRFRKKGIKIMTISSGLKEEFIKLGFIEKSILVVPDGVDLGEFGIATDRNQAREQVGLSLDKEIVLYTGHLFGWKGADVLVKAAGYFSEVLFVFVGGTEADVFEFRKRNRDRGNVIILGYRPHKIIPLYLKAADVLVLPNSGQESISRFYTSPLKLFEYMAAQRPIVASDLPSLREILNENNAVLVPPDNPSALAEGIRKVLSDSTLTESISRQARSDVQNYTWTKRAEKILKFVSENGY